MKYNLTLWSTSLKPAERNGTREWPFALYWLKGECSWRIWNSLLATSDLMYHLYHINFSASPRYVHVSKWIFISYAYMLNFSTSQPVQKLLKSYILSECKNISCPKQLRFQTVPATSTSVWLLKTIIWKSQWNFSYLQKL